MPPARPRIWLLTAWLALAGGGAWAQEALHMGLFPNVSPRTLVTMYEPLRLHLERGLGRPVAIRTAPDFHVHAQRLLERQYDVVVTAPHLTRLAQTDAGYRPVACYAQPVEAIIVVPAASPAARPADLRGGTLTTPDDVAVVTMLGQEMLAAEGLAAGRNYRFVEAKSHNNAALNVVNGQADAAVIGYITYLQMAPQIRQGLRILARSRAIPSQCFVASERLPASERARLRQSLFRFADTPAGRRFLEQHGLRGIVEPDPAALQGLDRFADQVRQLLQTRQKP